MGEEEELVHHKDLTGEDLHNPKEHGNELHTGQTVTFEQIDSAVGNSHARKHDQDSTQDHEALAGETDEIIVRSSTGMPVSSGQTIDDIEMKDHALGGTEHTADTLANLNAKISDANVDADTASRPPDTHSATHTNGTDDIQEATNAQKGLMSSAYAGKLDGIANNANNYSHPDHTGDVGSSGDGATTIGARKVDFAKLKAIATAKILGRTTADAGDVEELSATDVRTLINVDDGANNYSHPDHTGDVTSVGEGATTIASRAVTFAKTQVIATARLLGRITAESGDIEELTSAQAKGMLELEEVLNVNWLSEKTTADAGSALEIDWDDGLTQYITLTEDCAITFANARKNAVLTVLFTGDFEITLPAGTYGIDDEIPLLGAKSIMTVFYDGTGYIVIISPLYEIGA